MKPLIHPTHARTSRIAMGCLLAGAVAAFASGFYFNDGIGDSARTLTLVAAFMFFGMAFVAVFVLRAYVCKCPECRSWLVMPTKPDTDGATRRFVCRDCQIVWDSNVKFNVE